MKGISYSLVCAALPLLFVVIPTSGQESVHQQSVLKRRITVNFIDAHPLDVGRFLSRNYNVFTGVETVTYDYDQSGQSGAVYLPINLKCIGCSINDVLNQFIAIDNRYIWNYTDEVVHILPKDPDDRLVDTFIKEIQIKEKDLDDIRESIFKAPEVSEAIKKLSLTPLTFSSSFILGAKSGEEEKVWFSQTNTTLIKALNEITKKKGAKNWSIHKMKGKSGVIFLAL